MCKSIVHAPLCKSYLTCLSFFICPLLFVEPCRLLAASVQLPVFCKVAGKSGCTFIFHQLAHTITDPLMSSAEPDAQNCYGYGVMFLLECVPRITFLFWECIKAIMYLSYTGSLRWDRKV